MRAFVLTFFFVVSVGANAQNANTTTGTASIGNVLRAQQGVNKTDVFAKALTSGEVRVLSDSMLVDRNGNILGLTQKKDGRAIDFSLTYAGEPKILCTRDAMNCARNFNLKNLPTMSTWAGKNKVDALSFGDASAKDDNKPKPMCRKGCKIKTKWVACPTHQQPDKMCKQTEEVDCEWAPCATGALDAAMKASVAPVRVGPSRKVPPVR
jgi:hypothetical protein